MNPIFLEIEPLEIRYYGLMYAISFMIAIYFGKKWAEKKGINGIVFENFAFITIISGLIGARLYYVLLSLNYYLNNPLDIIAIWKGGLAIHGGIIGGFLGALFYSKKHKLNLWYLTDISAPFLLLGQGIGRIGNLTNGEIHGVPTFTPWNIIFSRQSRFAEWYEMYQASSLQVQMEFNELVPWGLVFPSASPAGEEFPNVALHPAMIYEMILNFIGFIILYRLYRKWNLSKGIITMIYIMIYAINRSFVSFFRAEDLMVMGMRAPHLISIVMFIIATLGIIVLNRKSLYKENEDKFLRT